MCGFVASIGHEYEDLADTGEGVESLTHRGPDEQGTWQHGERPLELSQCRLSIIDPPGGSQPMERGGNTLVYNGELYNYRSLRKKLENNGYNFRTDSDTEVFLNGFREWRFDFFDRIRGMFSAVIWDEANEETVLVRDHVGQKPLFYYSDSGQFLAASEIQGLLSADGIPPKADPASLSWYLSLGYVPSPRSAFFNIKKLPPAHYMVLNGPEIKRQVRYWDPVEQSRKPSPPDSPLETIRETLTEAVERRMISDVPLGAFLSGGLDSSIVVSLMSRLSDEPINTVSVGFENDNYDERDYAKQVADRFNTDHRSFSVSVDLKEILPDLAQHFGEPFADSSAVPTYYLSRKTSNVVKVALSGDGGDEAFGGYRRYRALKFLSLIKSVFPGAILSFVQSLASGLPGVSDRRSRFGEVKRILAMIGDDTVKQYSDMVGLGLDDIKQAIARGPLTEPAKRGGEQFLARWFKRFDHVKGPEELAMYVDLMSYLPGDLLVKTDITTMMNSLECRSPFLDRDVLELSFSLPSKSKISGSNHKVCLKETFGEQLPDDILKRKKMGFGVPLADWFRSGDKADYLQSVLHDCGTSIDRVIDQKQVENLLERHRSQKTDAGPFLWAVAMMKLWADQFDVRF